MSQRDPQPSRRAIDAADMRFDAPDEPDDRPVPRPARLVGPGDLGLNSRVDVYLHDGDDGDGEGEYATRASLRFDDDMIRRGAKALALQEGWRHDELDAGSECWLLHAEVCIRAALAQEADSA